MTRHHAKANNMLLTKLFLLTWFCFCFDFVHSHEWCRCYSIVCLRFQVKQTKQVDCKMSTKNVNNYK